MFKYDVAISYASEQRAFAEGIAEPLVENGVSVFYDAYLEADIWGKDLIEYLEEVYRAQSNFIVLLISKEYVAKPFTNLERKAALAGALFNPAISVLPVRFDNSHVPGLSPSIAYVSAKHKDPSQIAKLVLDKLGHKTPNILNRSTLPTVLSGPAESKYPRVFWRLRSAKYKETLSESASYSSYHAGRWNSAGTPVVYIAGSRALATVELLCHLENNEFNTNKWVVAQYGCPELISEISILDSALPEEWQTNVSITRAIGDDWIGSRKSCLLRVPSALVSGESNLLINPSHPDFGEIQLISETPFEFDWRLSSNKRT